MRQKTIVAGGFALMGALLVVLAPREQALAELVLRLDAMDASSVTLSTDMTDGMYTIGGVDFTDPRPTGLKFVEAWDQAYGATSNPAFHPGFLPMPNADGLFRPTYDPNGLGTGLPSVNFDFVPGDFVIGQGQRLYAALDDLVYSDNYSVFFVANHFGGSATQYAFGQDLDFRMAGWNANTTSAGRWRAGIRGTGSAAVTANSPGTVTGAAIRSFIGDTTNVIFDTVVSAGGVNTLTSATTVPAAGRNTLLLSGGEVSIGDRGGKIVGPSAPFNGEISEIAIFNTKLTVPQRDAINAFLANKWLGGPAPTAGEIATATTLLQQAPPTVGAPQLVRYEFWQEGGTGDPVPDLLIPEVVASGITASNFGTQSGAVVDPGTMLPLGISNSAFGIAARSMFLESSTGAALWHAPTTEQSPSTAGANYLTFTVTPDAGKQIDPSEFAFAFSRGEDANPGADIQNAVDSYGVWVGAPGGPFTKVGGQEGIEGPLGATAIPDVFYDTFKVDLSSVANFTAATEVRLYFWHDGPRALPGDYNQNERVDTADYVVWRKAGPTDILPNDPTPGVVDASDYDFWKANYGTELFLGLDARIDNVRLRGNVLDAGSGSGSAGVPEPASITSLLLLGGVLTLSRCGRTKRSGAPF
ncbi:MAG: hypothetical protein L0228_07970 [Planctomycetes bacterium]|nr:hypothetical protein [Planctomycetota bacterium]